MNDFSFRRLLVATTLVAATCGPTVANDLHCYPLAISVNTAEGANIVALMTGDGLVIKTLPSAICGTNGQGCWASFSPDGVHMMFSAANNGSATYSMQVDGSDITRISAATNAADTTPSYSPDGTKMVYAHVVNPSPLETSIMTANVDGTNPVTILPAVSGVYNYEPRWSSQNQIVFVQGTGGSSQIFVMSPTGTGLTQLTTTGLHGEPSWSPDGNTIVFGSAQPPSGNLNVYTMHKDGSSVTQVTNYVEPMEAADPSFSPDGKQVAFEVDNGGNYQSSPTAPATVYIVNSDGSNLHSTGVVCGDIGCHPTWSWAKQ